MTKEVTFDWVEEKEHLGKGISRSQDMAGERARRLRRTSSQPTEVWT